MIAVLMSIHPGPVQQIFTRRKTIEARKSYPAKMKIETPFRVYVYETKGQTDEPWQDKEGRIISKGRGLVVGEFTCIGFCRVMDFPEKFARHPLFYSGTVEAACLTNDEVEAYGNGRPVYGWQIGDVKEYREPKTIRDMHFTNITTIPARSIVFPPQSWCYVEVQPCKPIVAPPERETPEWGQFLKKRFERLE